MVLGELREHIRQAYKKVVQAEPPVFAIEPAKKPIFGDFSTNVALVGAEPAGQAPVALAQKIVAELTAHQSFRSVNVATPGFINFTVTDDYLATTVAAILKSPDNFGKSDAGKETRVLLEYVSANPTGPLTLANGRGAFVGEAIARVLELYGCTVMREFYLNDTGTQVDHLGHSVLHGDDPAKQYSGPYVDELRSRIKAKTDRDAGEEAVVIIMETMIKPVLRQLGINFHQFFSEKSLHQTGVYKKTMDLLKLRGLTYDADGATWLSTTRFGDSEDRVLVRSDGLPTYFANDIAYHSYKIQRGYHRLIWVGGADHFQYTRQMNMVIEGVLRDHYTWGGQLDWVITQIVRLFEKGKEVKMSKRAGNYVALDEVLDEVGADVARFFFLSRSVDSHLDFNFDIAKSSSSQNPVFYIQYAYARISSIFREFSKENEFELPEKIVLSQPAERQLLLRIIQFPDLVAELSGSLEVHKLAHFATALATDVHTFYEKLRVLGEPAEIAQSRLAILKAASITVKRTLELMGISAPSKMVKEKST
ncbi:MAG TPA: arginine--tRNA ligase [Candidatus Saccharimonadales bacterium]|nr:arginine--tRNA ligase [Candidatus Saccharimonadales bacterium]